MNEKLFHEIAEQVEEEFMCSGLTGGLYEDFAKEILVRYLAAQQSVQRTCFTCGGPVNTSSGYIICERGCGGPVTASR